MSSWLGLVFACVVTASQAFVASAAPPDGELPPGASWRYAYRDQRYAGGKRYFTVQVVQASGAKVRELFMPEQGDISQADVDTGEAAFVARTIAEGRLLVELAPYAVAPHASFSRAPTGYPSLTGVSWKVDAPAFAEEDVRVPAGAFKTVRVQVRGVVSHLGHGTTNSTYRFIYTVWYAPEAKRYVRARHQTWLRPNAPLNDELVELVEYDRGQPRGTAASGKAVVVAQPVAEGGAQATQAKPGRMPTPGTRWRYSFRDQQYAGSRQFYSITAVEVDGSHVSELTVVENGGDIKESVVEAARLSFVSRTLNEVYSVLELSPYRLDAIPDIQGSVPTRYPRMREVDWTLSPAERADETVSVPAGTFRAIRVRVTGVHPAFGMAPQDAMSRPGRFEYTVWYAPEVSRCVKVRHRLWDRAYQPVGDQVVELVSYERGGR